MAGIGIGTSSGGPDPAVEGKTTKTFSVEGDRDLHYTYDCSGDFVDEGLMQIWKDSTGLDDIYVNESGKRGKDVTNQHDGDGEMALEINSTCRWTVKCRRP